jgi:hypothetical protein
MPDTRPLAGFTAEGVRELLRAPRFQIAIARIETGCGARAAAATRLDPIRERARDGSVADVANAHDAAALAGGIDQAEWRPILESAERRAGELAGSEDDASGLLALARGRLLRALGRDREAVEQFRAVFLLPDRGLSHHLAREALR